MEEKTNKKTKKNKKWTPYFQTMKKNEILFRFEDIRRKFLLPKISRDFLSIHFKSNAVLKVDHLQSPPSHFQD